MMNGIDRRLPDKVSTENDRFQYVPDLHRYFLNDRVVGNIGHPSNSLRNLPLNGRLFLELPFPDCLANDKVAATLAVLAQQSVLPRTTTNVPTAILKGWQRLLEADIKLAYSSRFTDYLLNSP